MSNDDRIVHDLEALRDEVEVFPVLLEDEAKAAESQSASARGHAAWELLSKEEAARADRFTSMRAQSGFVLSRALLRRILGAYLQRPPLSLEFRYGDFGKPSLVEHPHLNFNVSHSGSLAVLAFTQDAALGVDIERLRSMPHALALVEQFFTAQESAWMRTLSEGERDFAFLSCWTRKEAAVKALGLSLDGQLASFTVPPGPMPVPNTIEFGGANLVLHDLALGPRAVGALAHDGAPRLVRIHPFKEAAMLLHECELKLSATERRADR